MMNTSMTNSTTWNIKRRRDFSQLKPGTELPGYRGYIEQYKYHVGDTYGNSTHKLSESWRNRHPAYTATPQNYMDPKTTYVGKGLSGSDDIEASGSKRELKLPKATGDNKLTEQMVPGYTGYIPRMPFKFGNTYKEDCDVCIDDFMRSTKDHDTKVHTLRKAQTQIKQMRPALDEETVISRLNQYRDRHPTSKVLLEDKRELREAPIPGYKGFVPRQSVTELGLGGRYHAVCDKSFNTFYDETERHADRIGRAYVAKATLPDDEAKASIQLTKEDRDVIMQRRLYKQIGMVPKYTGYLPHKTLYSVSYRSNEPCDRIGRAYVAKATLPDDEAKASIQLTKEDRDVIMQRRLYKQIGMVPKYTGYLPQSRFRFGQTYGDTTRSLPVCFHNQTTYGQHLTTIQQSV